MGIIIYLGLLSATWLFVEGAAPLQFIKKILNLHNESKVKNTWWSVIRKLVNCFMCMGFWIGLIYYYFSGNDNFFLMACITSITSEAYGRLINIILNKWLNQI